MQRNLIDVLSKNALSCNTMKELERAVKCRDYESIERIARSQLREGEWRDIWYSIISPRIDKNKGTDLLLSLLGIDALSGIEIDFIKLCSPLRGYSSLDDIRVAVDEKVRDLLKQQIAKNNTFFLDIEKIAKSKYAMFVDEIVESRAKEFLDLGDKINRRQAIATYYGFMILTMGRSIPKKYRGPILNYSRPRLSELESDSIDALSELGSILEKEIAIDGIYMVFGNNEKLRKKCDSDTYKLISNIFKMSLYKLANDREWAAEQIKDSRAVPHLLHRCEYETDSRVRNAILYSLSVIGHPSSFDYIYELHCKNPNALMYIERLGGFYNQRARNVLFQCIESENRDIRIAAIKGFRMLKLEDEYEKTVQLLEDKDRNVVEALIQDIPLTYILEHSRKVFGKLTNNQVGRNFAHRLVRLDAFSSNPDFQDYIAKILKSSMKRIRKLVQDHNLNINKIGNEFNIILSLLVETKPPFSAKLIQASEELRDFLSKDRFNYFYSRDARLRPGTFLEKWLNGISETDNIDSQE